MDATLTFQQQQQQGLLRLGGELTIYSAAELKPQLTHALDQVQELEINLSAVEELDTAGFQLLLLLKQEANRQGKILRLVGHSAAILEVFELLKMETFFGDPLVLAS